MKLYQLGKGVYKYYTNKVRGNRGLSHNMVQKKLTRNILASIKIETDDLKYDTIYVYGKLHIFTKGNTIVRLINSRMNTKWFYKDHKLISQLNKKLGIDSKQAEWKEVGNNEHINNEYIQEFNKIKSKIS